MKSSTSKISVRYGETDQMGVVYHVNYLVWFEIGRTDFIETLGLRYAAMEEDGFLSPVVDANLNFHYPVRYGEKPVVETWLQSYDGIRTMYAYEIRNEDGKLCVSGTSTHTVVKKENFRPVSIRRSLPEWHAAYSKALEA
ncbi:thioesterase family protein [Terribacillus sp. DMT04]|uniref:acyl-CoA thioesterase n=1 Tax=Terribacillus sp. DMT04 TaxID=2850441 RepID=UPI001C2B9FAF|nr:thioesterase family protein [Terribacillus sp. DMT04]QXE03206.1 acyl-CoA thioesterase [Terribacillus sp. DMT04]